MAHAPRWGFDLTPPVRAIASTGLGADRPLGLPAQPLCDAEWDAFFADAIHHRLAGLLVASVAHGELPATGAQRAAVAELEVELTAARMWHEPRLTEIVGVLTAADVEVRVLKGPALATLDYPDPQWRPTKDVDLLVRGEAVDRSVAALEAVGGQHTDFAVDRFPGFAATAGKGATVVMPDGLEVDLHRLLSWGPLGVRVPPDDLWRRRRTFERGGGRFETLGLEESLLHASGHLLLGGWRRALTLRDVAQLLASPDLDAERLLVTARRWGLEAVLATAVQLTRRELKTGPERSDHPRDDVHGERAIVTSWADGFPPRPVDLLWLRVQRPDQPVPFVGRLATTVELRTPAERRMLLRATAHTARESYRSAARPAGFLRMKLSRRDGGILGGPHATH